MDGLKIAVYVAAIFSSSACAVLQFRDYSHQRVRWSMWSAIFFAGLTAYNVALFVEAVILPSADLRLARLIPALIGGSCLVYGFVFDPRKRSS